MAAAWWCGSWLLVLLVWRHRRSCGNGLQHAGCRVPKPLDTFKSRPVRRGRSRETMTWPSAAPDQPVRTLLDAADMARVVDRIAHQVLEKTGGAGDAMLLGIPTRGTPLAARLAARIRAFEDVAVPAGSLDITLYRDDLRLRG